MTGPKLVIFDVDGTLIDSQAHIVAAMNAAFTFHGLEPPDRVATLSIVGLSLPVAMARLLPERPDLTDGLVAAYKEAFVSLRETGEGKALSPLFPRAIEALRQLADDRDVRLGVATGKSRRGLRHVFALHGLEGFFQSVQCADDHPSKPHPSMIAACVGDTGADRRRAVIVGDTTFDMDMARAAGIPGIGVSWGYHPAEALQLSGAAAVIDSFDALPGALDRVWGTS